MDHVYIKQIEIKESYSRYHIFTSVVFTTDEIDVFESATEYDSDAQQCIIGNSTNAHIWSVLLDFVPGTMRKFLETQ